MLNFCGFVVFFFKQKTAYEMRISDWSSDVCSSDLRGSPRPRGHPHPMRRQRSGRDETGATASSCPPGASAFSLRPTEMGKATRKDCQRNSDDLARVLCGWCLNLATDAWIF